MWLTTADVCQRLAVTRQTVWVLRNRGLIEAHNILGTSLIRFKASDVDALLTRKDTHGSKRKDGARVGIPQKQSCNGEDHPAS